MPSLWKFKSKAAPDAPKVEAYQFTETEDLSFELDEPEPLEHLPQASPLQKEEEPEERPEPSQPENPVSFAQIQSDRILQDAQSQADEILRQAQERAQEMAEQARAKAEEEGYQAGFQEGMQQGMRKALDESVQAREALAQRLEVDVAKFIEKADRAVQKQLDDNLDDLRDLALAVAEKVVCVSLKSSSEVIGRMIQSAIDKRTRREWAHIYIAECDARRLTNLPASLTAALSELSDRVRIIPMADDEAGTCIIECPDEIIDASAATQMQNIRDMLSTGTTSGITRNFNFKDK